MIDLPGKPPAYPSLKQSWGLLGLTLLAALVLNIVLLAGGAILTIFGKGGLGQSILTHSLTFLLSYVLLLVFIIWLGVRKKRNTEGFFSPNYAIPSRVLLLPIALVTLGIYFLVDPIVDLIPMPDFMERLFLELLGDQNIWTVLALIVAAPICEELLLRGIILDGLLKIYSPRKAIIWSAVFFGLFHLNPWQFIPALALGLFMGWIYYRTRSLSISIFIHFLANVTGVVLGFILLPESDELVPTRLLVGNNGLYFSLLAIDFILVVLFLFLLNKKLAPPKIVENMTSS